jgi:hypothetical protein
MSPLGSRTGLVARMTRCRLDRCTVVLGIAGAVAGGLCGLLGVAGGVVIVPVLTSRRVGMARAAASGTTIAAVIPISAVAAVTYAGLHNVDGQAASAIVPGAAVGVVAGSLLAARVRAPVLRTLFNLVLLATAVRLLVALPSGSVQQIAVEVPAAVTLCALGMVAGLASGMLGSGGGTFLVPALVLGWGTHAPQDAHAQAARGGHRGLLRSADRARRRRDRIACRRPALAHRPRRLSDRHRRPGLVHPPAEEPGATMRLAAGQGPAARWLQGRR